MPLGTLGPSWVRMRIFFESTIRGKCLQITLPKVLNFVNKNRTHLQGFLVEIELIFGWIAS